MPAPIRITLSTADQKRLEKNVKSRTAPVRLLERSQIILLAAQGMPNYKIAEELDIEVNKAGRWRNRFADNGLPGIEKELPGGANPGGKNTEEQAPPGSKIIQITTQDKPEGATHWSTRRLAITLVRLCRGHNQLLEVPLRLKPLI